MTINMNKADEPLSLGRRRPGHQVRELAGSSRREAQGGTRLIAGPEALTRIMAPAQAPHSRLPVGPLACKLVRLDQKPPFFGLCSHDWAPGRLGRLLDRIIIRRANVSVVDCPLSLVRRRRHASGPGPGPEPEDWSRTRLLKPKDDQARVLRESAFTVRPGRPYQWHWHRASDRNLNPDSDDYVSSSTRRSPP